MNAIEIARTMAEHGQKQDAMKAYMLVLQDVGSEPVEQMEAAVYILHAGGDHRISCTSFQKLYNEGYFQDEILRIMTDAFYTPNVRQFKNRYERNCKLLARYAYFSRTDFLPFEELPLRFFPYDENGFLLFYEEEKRFGEYVNFNYPAVTQNFFKDLDKPVRADDVYSQYELQYLNDNVRKSEFVGRENHIYLCYSDWSTFCAYLQCLNFRKLLEDKKFVFLFENEIQQYPIDFKEKYGIDYSRFPVKPIDISEVNRLIWHVQFSSHNGGDFFNEIFDGHPNLIMVPSIFLSDAETLTDQMEQSLLQGQNCVTFTPGDGDMTKLATLMRMLRKLKRRTRKDMFVAGFMFLSDLRTLDRTARIVPAIFFQPHFPNIHYSIGRAPNGTAFAFSPEYEQIHCSSVFKSFPYIKAFAPVRRFTTSYGGALRTQHHNNVNQEGQSTPVAGNVIMQRMLNRSYLIDPQLRIYKDCRLVRFEDGKLNPTATFTALSAFLDLPYTESMTYCSMNGERDPLAFEANVRGFDTASVYKTYDEYANDDERCYLEYFLQEAYEYCGYDFHYYDGRPMDLDYVKKLIKGFTTLRHYNEMTRMKSLIWDYRGRTENSTVDMETARQKARKEVDKKIAEFEKTWVECAEMMLRGDLRFLNPKGQPLRMMPKLELEPALLERPLYH